MTDSKITVYFATNRNRVDGEEYFGSLPVSPRALFRVGRAVVDVSFSRTSDGVPDERTRTRIHELEVFEESPSEDGTGFDKVGSKRLVPELAKTVRERKVDVLCIIPGFNYTFRESVERAALLAALYSKDKSPPLIATVFSWPSDGSLSKSGYLSDRDDAEDSDRAIARVMDRFSRLFRQQARHKMSGEDCGQRIHLLAHSLGVHALKHAVKAYRDTPGAQVRRIFDTAILAAADTERDALGNPDKLAPLAHLARSVHCYINPEDKALDCGSDYVGPPGRLGSDGPSEPNLVQTFGAPLSIIDCRRAWTIEDGTNHQYYRMSAKVIDDIAEVIAGCQKGEFTHRQYVEERGVYLL